MSEPVNDTREMVIEGNINIIKQYFKEPYFATMPEDLVAKCRELYEIAAREDTEDPVGWIRDFNSHYPINFEMGTESSRIGKILECAKISLKKAAAKEDKSK